MRKLIIALFLFLLPGIFAALNDSEVYLSFDDNLDDLSGNSINAVNSGTTNTTGKLGSARSFDGVNDYLSIDNLSIASGDHSVQAWVWLDSSTSNHKLVDTTSGRHAIALRDSSISNNIGSFDNSAWRDSGVSATTGSWKHYVFVFSGSSTNFSVYIDGVRQGGSTHNSIGFGTATKIGSQHLGTGDFMDATIDEFAIWSRYLSEEEISQLYNNGTGFNPYATGPAPPPGPSTNLSINTTNLETPTTKLNFTSFDAFVTMTTNNTVDRNDIFYNPIEIETFLSGMGTLNQNEQYGFFINNASREVFFEFDIINTTAVTARFDYGAVNYTLHQFITTGIDLDGDLTDDMNIRLGLGGVPNFAFDAQDLEQAGCDANFLNLTSTLGSVSQTCNKFKIAFTGLSEGNTTFNFTADDTYSQSFNSTNYILEVDSVAPVINSVNIPSETTNYTLYNISVNYTEANFASCTIDWDDGSQSDCSGLIPNKTFEFNGNHSYNITVLDTFGKNDTLSGTFLINPIGYVYFTLDNGSNVQDFNFGGTNFTDFANFTFYNDVLTVGQNNTLEFSKDGYAIESFTFFVPNNDTLNITFNVTPAAVNINIYDKETLQPITTPDFDLEFVGPIGLLTNTSGGSASFEAFFISGEYRVIASNADFETESVFFTFNGSSNIDVDIYVINSSNPNVGFVTVEVIDQNGQPIENVTVSAKQWDVNSSAYITVSQQKTSEDGKGELNIILDNKLYVFRAEKNGFSIETIEQIITTANNGKTITLTLVLEESVVPSYTFEGYNINVTRSPEPHEGVNTTISFTWSNSAGTAVTGCTNSYRLQNGVEVLLTESCTTSVGTTKLNVFTLNSSYDILIKSGFEVDGVFKPVKTFRYQSEDSLFNQLSLYGLHFILLLFMDIGSIALGLHLKNVYIGSFLLIISSLVAIAIAPNIITTSVAAFLGFVGMVAVAGGSR